MTPVVQVRDVDGGPGGARGPAATTLVVLLPPGPDGPRVDRATAALAGGWGVDLARRVRRARLGKAAGSTLVVELETEAPDPERLLLVVAGSGADDLRAAGAAAARAWRSARQVAVRMPPRASVDAVAAFAEGALMAGYRFQRRSRPPETPSEAERIDLLVPAGSVRAARAAVAAATVRAAAVRRARDLANTPSNEKSPFWLVEQARRVAEESGLAVQVLEEDELRDGGFGGLTAVGAGSAHGPALVELRYVPPRATASTPHVVLVGKGITFDTGGLSLKPAEPMVPMKTDMSGAAAVLAVAGALRALRVRSRVTVLLAIAENMPGAAAFRPGDVLTQYGGTTTEVLNTDAEGRLVLADALAYADAHLAPDVVVDVATLTGAASLGLGRIHGALLTPDDALARDLARAATAAGEPLWRLPLHDDYAASLNSPIADVRHITTDRTVGGGAITAALFLRRFVGERRWAHLDIAGPARSDSDRGPVTRGGTGYATGLLLRWVESLG